MNTIEKTDSGVYALTFRGLCIENPFASENCFDNYDPDAEGGGAHSPQHYGFEKVSTGGGFEAWGQTVLLNGRKIEMLLTTEDGGTDVRPGEDFVVGLYHDGSPLMTWSIRQDGGDFVPYDVEVHEPDFLSLPKISDDEVLELATQAALNAACKIIQDVAGADSGDFASHYWSGENADALRDCLRKYLKAERDDVAASAQHSQHGDDV